MKNVYINLCEDDISALVSATSTMGNAAFLGYLLACARQCMPCGAQHSLRSGWQINELPIATVLAAAFIL